MNEFIHIIRESLLCMGGIFDEVAERSATNAAINDFNRHWARVMDELRRLKLQELKPTEPTNIDPRVAYRGEETTC